MKAIFIVLVFTLHLGVRGNDLEEVSLPVIPDVERADVYFLKVTDYPVGLLVLCPGCNGNGRDWIVNPKWQQFGRDNKVDLVGISFASQLPLLKAGKGYYYARLGSGHLLLDAIARKYDSKLPLLLFGFSGGAHFVSGFAELHPERVKAWCAYSAAWWDKPAPSPISSPGLIICGGDDFRLGASLIYFKQGRALGRPWLWCSPVGTGHEVYPPAEDFVRKYLSSELNPIDHLSTKEWVDIDKCTEELVSDESQPSVLGLLPNKMLFRDWKELNAHD